MDELKTAQDLAMKHKKGMHGKDNAAPPKLNDFSVKGGGGRAKECF
jgi:hypothetical protein